MAAPGRAIGPECVERAGQLVGFYRHAVVEGLAEAWRIT